ncbi:MAG: DUF481 domain-containing protein [Bacteroidota bacterium]
MTRLFLVFMPLLTFQVHAQIVNIENKRIYDDTSGWSGAVDASFSAVRNKDLLLTGSFRPRVQFKSRYHYGLLITDWVYSKGADRVFANSGMIHLRYAYRMGRHDDHTRISPWKWESYAQVQYNQLLDQRLRALGGTGLRWKAIDQKGVRLFAGTSFFYEHEELQSTGELIKDVRWNSYISCFIDPGTSWNFTATTYVQPVVNYFSDFRILGQYALTFQFLKRIDFRLEYNTFYDTRPPSGVREWVFSGSAGIRVKLGE